MTQYGWHPNRKHKMKKPKTYHAPPTHQHKIAHAMERINNVREMASFVGEAIPFRHKKMMDNNMYKIEIVQKPIHEGLATHGEKQMEGEDIKKEPKLNLKPLKRVKMKPGTNQMQMAMHGDIQKRSLADVLRDLSSAARNHISTLAERMRNDSAFYETVLQYAAGGVLSALLVYFVYKQLYGPPKGEADQQPGMRMGPGMPVQTVNAQTVAPRPVPYTRIPHRYMFRARLQPGRDSLMNEDNWYYKAMGNDMAQTTVPFNRPKAKAAIAVENAEGDFEENPHAQDPDFVEAPIQRPPRIRRRSQYAMIPIQKMRSPLGQHILLPVQRAWRNFEAFGRGAQTTAGEFSDVINQHRKGWKHLPLDQKQSIQRWEGRGRKILGPVHHWARGFEQTATNAAKDVGYSAGKASYTLGRGMGHIPGSRIAVTAARHPLEAGVVGGVGYMGYRAIKSKQKQNQIQAQQQYYYAGIRNGDINKVVRWNHGMGGEIKAALVPKNDRRTILTIAQRIRHHPKQDKFKRLAANKYNREIGFTYDKKHRRMVLNRGTQSTIQIPYLKSRYTTLAGHSHPTGRSLPSEKDMYVINRYGKPQVVFGREDFTVSMPSTFLGRFEYRKNAKLGDIQKNVITTARRYIQAPFSERGRRWAGLRMRRNKNRFIGGAAMLAAPAMAYQGYKFFRGPSPSRRQPDPAYAPAYDGNQSGYDNQA
jgi:hypothetical protein